MKKVIVPAIIALAMFSASASFAQDMPGKKAMKKDVKSDNKEMKGKVKKTMKKDEKMDKKEAKGK